MFHTMCTGELQELSSSKSFTNYKKGQILFSEGGRPQGVFCINKGKIKVYKLGQDGKQMIVYICSGGDLLGYNAVVSDDVYAMTAEVLEDSTICFIPRSDFKRGLETSINLKNELLRVVTQQESILTNRITSLAQKTVRERLAATLLHLQELYGMQEEVSDGINLSREDLANMVGTATESLIRLLHDLKDEGLVEINGRKVKVLRPDKLRLVAKAA